VERRIPRFIDDPPQLLWWEMDELVAVVGLFGMGIFIDHPAVGVLTGIGLARQARRYKVGRADHYLWHLLYRMGWVKGSPSGTIREMFE
jgi:conjugal transfer pilus assembly protein TraL